LPPPETTKPPALRWSEAQKKPGQLVREATAAAVTLVSRFVMLTSVHPLELTQKLSKPATGKGLERQISLVLLAGEISVRCLGENTGENAVDIEVQWWLSI